jgi:hypothetical protein
MTLPHQYHEKEEGKDGKEGHHPVYPANCYGSDPGVDIEVD